MVTVNNFSNGLLNPALAYVVSCLGACLGLLCVSRGRIYQGVARASWLMLAALSIGATGIWAMHFVAMLGFSVPGAQVTYDLVTTIQSMMLAILVVGVGLFIVGYGKAGWTRLTSAGLIVGIGVAGMHYLGMDGMKMPYNMHYNVVLVGLSVVIAIVAGTAALWAGTHVSGMRDAVGASLIMGIAVSGMHYTGMAALEVSPNSTMATSPGVPPFSFVLPLVVGLTIITFGITMAVILARTEAEIAEDAVLTQRAREIEDRQNSSGAYPLQGRLGQPESPAGSFPDVR